MYLRESKTVVVKIGSSLLINEDKKITNGELLAYMDENVSQKAAELGREQNPSLAGDPDKVLKLLKPVSK